MSPGSFPRRGILSQNDNSIPTATIKIPAIIKYLPNGCNSFIEKYFLCASNIKELCGSCILKKRAGITRSRRLGVLSAINKTAKDPAVCGKEQVLLFL